MDSTEIKPSNIQSFYKVDGRWKLLEKKHPAKHTCVARYCQREPREGKRFCHKCASRVYRANNPMMYAFHNHRHHARQRGIPHTLTFSEFAELVEKSGWISGKGKTAEALSIDRIDASKGYVQGNLQVISLSENSRKRFVDERVGLILAAKDGHGIGRDHQEWRARWWQATSLLLWTRR